MTFKNRKDAGIQLAKKIKKYKNAIVLGLPRGGVVVAAEIAKICHLPLDILIIRKMGAPFNPELAIGAVDENGEGILNDEIIENLGISEEHIQAEREKEKDEAIRRLKMYRKDKDPLNVTGKTVILVDDGLATGATMRAAVHSLRKKNSKKIIVAVPVGALESLKIIEEEADEMICLYAPEFFGAVGAFYDEFNQTTDEEVIELLKEWKIN